MTLTVQDITLHRFNGLFYRTPG